MLPSSWSITQRYLRCRDRPKCNLATIQVSVEDTRQRVILRGILPGEVPKIITIEQTSACMFNERQIASVAFLIEVALR